MNVRCNNKQKCIYQKFNPNDNCKYCEEVNNKQYAVFNCYFLEEMKEDTKMPYGGELKIKSQMFNDTKPKYNDYVVVEFNKKNMNLVTNVYKNMSYETIPKDEHNFYYVTFFDTEVEVGWIYDSENDIFVDPSKDQEDDDDIFYSVIKDSMMKDKLATNLSETQTKRKTFTSNLEDSGDRTKYTSGAVRDRKVGKGRCDLLPGAALIRLSKHFEKGSIKYGDSNWKKGIPISSFIDSALRHIFQYMEGEDNEDVLCAAAWNLICAMWTEEKRPEMQDIVARMDYVKK